MKNQTDYFDKIIKVLKDLKKDHPNVEVSRHYLLATDNNTFPLSDKDLYDYLIKYRSELYMNTISDEEILDLINNPEKLYTEDDWNDEDLDEEY